MVERRRLQAIVPDCPTYENIKRLAQELNRPASTLIVLDTINDPFYAGVDARKYKGEWFAKLWKEFNIPHGIHLRGIHYMLVSEPERGLKNYNGLPYENTQECWHSLQYASLCARYLDLVDPNAFVEQRSEEPLLAIHPDARDAAVDISPCGGICSSFESSPPSFPRLSITAPAIRQRYLVEIWVEKSTQDGILRRLYDDYDVNIQTGVGQQSEVRCREFVKRVEADGRPCRILYVSDFDPGGQSMPVAVARKIEFIVRKDYPGLDIQVRPILLTEQQCRRYRLPRTPIKETDRGRERFEERFGEGATELDALEVLHPGAIEEILTTEIKRYYDDTLSRRVRQFAARKQRELDEINEQVTAKYQDRIDALTSDYDDLVNEYNNEIGELLERRDEIGDVIKDELRAQQPNLDDYAWPEPAEGNEDLDTLFDSTRDYVEQVDRFKRHQDKPTRRRTG